MAEKKQFNPLATTVQTTCPDPTQAAPNMDLERIFTWLEKEDVESVLMLTALRQRDRLEHDSMVARLRILTQPGRFPKPRQRPRKRTANRVEIEALERARQNEANGV